MVVNQSTLFQAFASLFNYINRLIALSVPFSVCSWLLHSTQPLQSTSRTALDMGTDSVEVMFDYKYTTSDNKHVTINKGDIFTLLDKSTKEWWKVCKEDRDKFYVPANYVRLRSNSSGSTSTDSVRTSGYISIHSDIPPLSRNGHHRTASNNSTGSDSYLDSYSCDSSLDSKGESSDRVSSLPSQFGLSASSEFSDDSHMNNSMRSLNLNPTITVTQVSKLIANSEVSL